jgi:DNA-binding MarR family transcriptional regulator
MIKLTPRQRAFLDKLFDLHREHQGPVHYSLVAEKLGVNKFSAYDMLKLLEKKGMARSDYVLTAEHAGPGRSMIVFSPTQQAANLFSQLTGDVNINEEWRQLKERILQRLQETKSANYRELLNELLVRIPEHKSPLIYCTEMITALLLNLNRAKEKAGDINPFRALSSLGSTGEAGLGALAGLSLGSTLLMEKAEPSLRDKLLSCTKRYHTYLLNLSEEAKASLSDFLEEALVVFERTT